MNHNSKEMKKIMDKILENECPYCKDHSLEDIPIRSNADTSKTLVIIAQGDNKKEIVFSHKGVAFGVEINFCPICGKNLIKANQTVKENEV